MENLTNQVITLDNNHKYFILRQALYKGKTYFLAAGVTDDEEHFNNKFLFFEKVNDEENFRVEEVTDESILSVLAPTLDCNPGIVAKIPYQVCNNNPQIVRIIHTNMDTSKA